MTQMAKDTFSYLHSNIANRHREHWKMNHRGWTVSNMIQLSISKNITKGDDVDLKKQDSVILCSKPN